MKAFLIGLLINILLIAAIYSIILAVSVGSSIFACIGGLLIGIYNSIILYIKLKEK